MSPRHATRRERGFIWLPRETPLVSKIEINGEDVTVDIISSEFTKGVCPEVGQFRVDLINSDEKYTERYSQDQFVDLYADFTNGTTKIFRGKIDSIKNKYDSARGFLLSIDGGHLTRDLLNVTVIDSFDGDLTCDEILIDIIEDNASTFTTTNVEASTVKPTVNWNNKPLWDCINDLIKLAEFDAYVDEDSDIHFFEKNSRNNDNEAIVWNDTHIRTDGLGQQTITTKNKIITYGDDGTGLPIISTSNNLDSQSLFGIKELAIFDNNANTEENVKEIGDAELADKATPTEEGEAESLILPSIAPGERIYITNPTMKINGRFRIYGFTHRIPEERSMIVVGKERKTKQIFKKRVENELKAQIITNPFKMESSINFTFDDLSKIATKDANVNIEGGKLILTSGVDGVATSIIFSVADGISEAHLRVIGSNIVGTEFEISTDGGNTYEDLVLEGKKVLTNAVAEDADVVIRFTFNSATTELDSVAILHK